MTSGLVLTLNADPAVARQAQALLQSRPELTLGECNQRWLPLVAETPDVPASRDLHDWLNQLPGVEFVDVVHVSFEDAESPNPTSMEKLS